MIPTYQISYLLDRNASLSFPVLHYKDTHLHFTTFLRKGPKGKSTFPLYPLCPVFLTITRLQDSLAI